MLEEVVGHLPNIRIEFFKGLLVEFAAEDHGADGDRQGPPCGVGLRVRAADGPDEPAPLGRSTPSSSRRARSTRSSRRAWCARWPSSVATSRAWCRRASRRGSRRSSRRAGSHRFEGVPATHEGLATDRASSSARPMTSRSCSCGRPGDDRDRAPRCRCRRRCFMVNRDEALDVLDEALQSMPEELRQARWLLKERDEYLRQGPAGGRGHRRRRRGCRPSGWSMRTEVVSARPRRGRPQQVVDDAEADLRRPPARGRGLHRPEAGQLRGRPRAHDAGRAAKRRGSGCRWSSGRCPSSTGASASRTTTTCLTQPSSTRTSTRPSTSDRTGSRTEAAPPHCRPGRTGCTGPRRAERRAGPPPVHGCSTWK